MLRLDVGPGRLQAVVVQPLAAEDLLVLAEDLVVLDEVHSQQNQSLSLQLS